MKNIIKDTTVSRRGVLQGMAAVAAMAMTACSKNEDSVFDWVDAPVAQGDIQFNEDVQIVNSTGPHNCGARCHHKVHVKNDRIIGFTSAGDIDRKGSINADENVGEVNDPMQRRACVRGYGYTSRIYQPDRLKYPLVQTGEKGDISTFKRVSWDEAIDRIAEAIKKAYERKSALGYTPIVGRWFFPGYIENKLFPAIVNYFGNESTGSQDAAKYDSVGINAYSNSVSDMLNSKFILIWGLDPTRSTYWKEHAHWLTTKAKEKNIPIVVISPTCSDAAAVLASGVKDVAISGGATANLPGWIPIRPATDGLLAETMAYIIWKDGLITPENRKFLEEKCFGFSRDVAHRTVISSAPERMIADYDKHMVVKPKNITKPADYTNFDPVTGVVNQTPYNGTTFTVQETDTFEYHLAELETLRGGRSDVIQYAAKVTGIPAKVIEALAYKYGSCNTDSNPSLLDVGGGPQRAWNGMEWSWLCIALTAMTGNIKRSGGGAGFAMTGFADKLAFDQQNYMYVPDPGFMLNAAEVANSIQIQTGHLGHLLMTGKDRRSWVKFQEGVKITTSGYYNPTDIVNSPRQDGVNLNAYMGVNLSAPLEIDMIYVRNGNILTTTENINKMILGFKKTKTVLVVDTHMTPTAAHADIVLPACSHLESAAIGMPNGSNSCAAVFPMGKAVNTLWDSKPDAIIEKMIIEKLIEKGVAGYSTADLPGTPLSSQTVYSMAQPSKLYKAKVDTENKVKMKPFADLVKDGVMELVVPPSKPIIGMKDFYDIDKSNLQTSTGRMNFYSPLWGELRPKTTYTSKVFVKDSQSASPREITDFFEIGDVNWRVDGIRNATAKYQPLFNGFESFKPKNGVPTYTSKVSGRDYTLQYMTNKSRHRAHTVLSNIALLDDNFKQRVKINTLDAAKRGIVNNDMVYVYNDRGCMKIEAEVTDYIIPGAVSIEHGAWYRAHPTEACDVWLDTSDDTANNLTFTKYRMPVDVGGADNILTYDVSGAEQYVGQAVSAQGGPCEVSKIKPD